MKNHYAQNTSVSVEKSQQEVQNILRKYGADAFGVMERKDIAYLMFEYNGLMIQITVPLPKKEEFIKTDTGRSRKNNQAEQAYEQAIRQRWRALVLAVKAKLEAVESGISTIEKEFLAFVMMPDGKQLSDHLLPQLLQIASTGRVPKLLPGGLQ
jgi:hypothetical protein